MLKIPHKLFLIKPNHFKINEQAIPTNKFMTLAENKNNLQEKVFKEHQGLYTSLINHNFDVTCFENIVYDAPDALFGNNWISVHHPHETKRDDLLCIIYPMALENRRIEVREDILDYVKNSYHNTEVLDLRLTYDWAFLEGTGSIVYDRINRIMYAALSPRTYYWKLLDLSRYLKYKLIICHTNYKNACVYHTNVLMSIGETWAVVCFDVIYDCNHNKIRKNLKKSNKEIIEISAYQMSQYCGNIIEIVNKEGISYTVMSATAYNAFTPDQLQLLGNIIQVPFETIEKYGGGGVRCCITEI
jgi:hypothetical protein